MKLEIRNWKLVILVVSTMYLILFLWLFHRHFVPFGVWSAALEAPQTETRLVNGPTPEYRIEVDRAEKLWYVKETPVYFDVSPPRKFDHAQMRVRFRPDVPIIFGGVVKNHDPWRMEQHVLYHKYLEELDWPRIEDDDLILWQREPRYESVEGFLENPPDVEEVATVDVGVYPQFPISNSQFPINPQKYEISLRGSHDIYLYTAGEDIEVIFSFHDVNRHDGKDEVEVRLFDSDEVIESAMLEDDGVAWGTEESRPPRELIVRHDKPEPGVYRLTVHTTDDVFIRRVETHQQKIVWKGRLYLGDEVGYPRSVRPLTVYSNGQGFALRTPHPESVQKIAWREGGRTVGEMDITKHNKQYTIQMPRDVAGDIVAISTPKRDLLLNSDGLFALSEGAFFLPDPIAYVSDLTIDRLGINYVLARYTLSKEHDDWRSGTTSVSIFDIDQSIPLQFFIGTPLGGPNALQVKEVEWTLKRPALTPRRVFATLGAMYAQYNY